MNREEAIRKLEYSKKAYQMLIDEKVDSGKLVGKDVKGEWKADTPLDEAYKSMIDALEMAIKALEQEPCPDVISRSDMLDAIGHGTTYTSEELQRIIKGLPPVTPQPKMGHWINAKVGKLFPSNDFKCSECGNILDFNGVNCGRGDANYCPNCGAKMQEVEE